MLIALAVSYPDSAEPFYGLYVAADVEEAKTLHEADPLSIFQPGIEEDGHIVLESREALDAWVDEHWENPYGPPQALTGYEDGQAVFIDPTTLF